MKKVMVTGGAGFLGSHVADRLQASGYDVLIFDQKPAQRGKFAVGDLLSLDDLLQATRGVDYVCHLAGVGDVYLAFEQPWLASAANVVGTTNVMEAALRNGIKKVIYASSWEVYGKPHYQPIDEAHPCEPDHFYNITKLAGERIALTYDHLKGVPTVALRMGTAYGERMRPNTVFSIFITRALRGEPLTIRGSGEQSRQFTHVRDLANAYLKAIESSVHNEAFNTVSPESVSIKRLAEMVVAIVPTKVTFDSERPGDVAPVTLSAEKAQKALSWSATVPFKQGLEELIAYYQRMQAGK